MDNVSLAESVEKLKKKTIKNMKKWNNENFYAIDRQLISSGIRLLLFLQPLLFWHFEHGHKHLVRLNGGWILLNQLESKFCNHDCRVGFHYIARIYLSMALHRHRVNLSIQNFRSKVKQAEELHLSVRSLHGYANRKYAK